MRMSSCDQAYQSNSQILLLAQTVRAPKEGDFTGQDLPGAIQALPVTTRSP